MLELKYKAKKEKRYYLDGKWWIAHSIDKVVTFENLDYGGFSYGVILSLIDGNELRVVSEVMLSHLRSEYIEVEPLSIKVVVRFLNGRYKSVFDPAEFLIALFEEMNYDRVEQINYPHRLYGSQSDVVAFLISKGSTPIIEVLNLAGEGVQKLGGEVLAVISSEGINNYGMMETKE